MYTCIYVYMYICIYVSDSRDQLTTYNGFSPLPPTTHYRRTTGARRTVIQHMGELIKSQFQFWIYLH